MHGAAAHPDHRVFCTRHQLGKFCYFNGIDRRIGMRRQRLLRRDFAAHRELFPRHFQCHRPRPPRLHGLERAGHQIRRRRRMIDPLRPFQQRPQRRQLIRQFMQGPAQLADQMARHLPGQAQNPRIHPPGGSQSGGGVQHPRPRHHRIRRRLASGAGIPQRHVGRGLLMPRIDKAQAIGVLRECIEQPINLHAGQAEYRIDSMAQ